MKLHSDTLDLAAVMIALRAAQNKGHVTNDVIFVKFDRAGSRSRKIGCEIQLGTHDQTTGPTKSRHYKNSGNSGATSGVVADGPVWAATYDEWGWFLAEIFKADPDAIFGGYKGVRDFHAQTQNKYRDTLSEWP